MKSFFDPMIRLGLLALALAAQVPAGATAPRPAAIRAESIPSTVEEAACSWNRPGVNPFMGDVVGAVDRYQDIPPDVRARLKDRMARREYDDLVAIRRDSIVGRGGYAYTDAIRDMHFGTNRVCHSVTRAAWTPDMEERGLVYCESGQCILVPTVCRNVSRVGRRGVGNDVAEGLPPFLPPGAGYPPPADGAAPPLGPELAFIPGPLPLDAFPASAAGIPLLEGGPIGDVPYTGGYPSAAPLAGGVGPAGLFGASGGGGGGAAVGAPASPASTGDTGSTPSVQVPVVAVPEPSTWLLTILGGLLLAGVQCRRPTRRRLSA